MQAESRQLSLSGQTITVHIRRSQRRSVGLLIDQGQLRVTVPLRFELGQLATILQDKAGWILGKLALQASLPKLADLASSMQLDWLGEPRHISLGHARQGVDADQLLLRATCASEVPAALEQLMRREARQFLGERLAQWAQRLSLQYSRFALSGARKRWGSCSSRGAISLNFRLMQAPMPIIDYVLIHELCHLVELNHSPRFWALVAAACPDYQARRAWLKREGARYLAW